MRTLRTLLMAAVICGSLVMTSGIALAGREWCDDDPIFVLSTGAFRAYTTWGTGAGATGIGYVLDVPSNVAVRVIVPPTAGGPTSVVVRQTLPAWSGAGAVSMVLHTTLTAARSTRVQVTVNGKARGSATGTADHTIDLPVVFR